MKLTTTTQVSVDGVMQGPGVRDEDERGALHSDKAIIRCTGNAR